MSDVVVELWLDNSEDDERFATALDTFVMWQDESGAAAADNAPDMMVRTSFDASGALSKKVIFQDRKWADAFLHFWRNHDTVSGQSEA